jgi:hypothetical protein
MLEWEIIPESVVLVSLTPLYANQTGEDHRWESELPDPMTNRNELLNFVSGLGHELNLVPFEDAPKEPKMRRRGTDFRVQNTFHVKGYLYRVSSTEILWGRVESNSHKQSSEALGIGDGLRFSLTRWLFLKGSYEYARRLPDPLEIFGDGAEIAANAELRPEVSHNANFGPLLDWKGTPAGDFVALANLAYRDSSDMIVLLGNLQFQNFRNVYHAKTWSGEGGLSWVSPRQFVAVDWSATVNDSRNHSESGPFAEFVGDPIPNRSPFGTSWAIRLGFDHVIVKRDRIEPFYQGRYTEGFYRSWASQGITEFKDRVEDQVAHDGGITYINQFRHTRLTNTLEVQNIANAALFDDFGVQRPGRAFYWKVTADVF